MKPTKGILGCALAAGLMTLAAGKAQAGMVIGGDLYVVLKLKLTLVSQVGPNLQIDKNSFISKDILSNLNLPTTDELAINEANQDVYVINPRTHAIEQDLTASNILSVETSEFIVDNKDGKNGAFSEKSGGTVDIGYEGNHMSFEVSGVYKASEKGGGEIGNTATQDVSVSEDFESLTGSAEAGVPHLIVYGTATTAGSGKIGE